LSQSEFIGNGVIATQRGSQTFLRVIGMSQGAPDCLDRAVIIGVLLGLVLALLEPVLLRIAPVNAAETANFVGARACGECHAAETKLWRT
jgi:hypothetical protein